MEFPDDKGFLETEMRNLNRAPSGLLKTSDDRGHKPVETYKRRRKMTRSPTGSMSPNIEKQMSAPPMTFDQGTQTDLKSSTDGTVSQSIELFKISQQIDMLLIENQHLRKENQQTKQMVTDLINCTYDLKGMLKDMKRKIDLNDRDPHIINSQMKANNEPIVLFTKSSNQIVNLNPAEIDHEMSIETYDVNNETSNISYSNCSRLSAASNASIQLHNSTMMASQKSSPSTVHTTSNNAHSSMEDIKQNWNVIEIDEISDEIVIGANGTKVHKSVLDTIKWTSHSHATRKLLSYLFTREILATHSLTGKPSPGKRFALFSNILSHKRTTNHEQWTKTKQIFF